MRDLMKSKKDEDRPFSKEESDRRFIAAIKGAKLAGHRPMESLPQDNPKKQQKPKKKSKAAV
jgi:hypothetical protein